MLDLSNYSGATRVIYVVGDPISQVKSPFGVTELLRQRSVDSIVVPAHVVAADLAAWLAAMQAMRNCDGIIVTVPHKFAALGSCRRATAQAQSIGAVNVMRREPDGGWYGDMCDGTGYVAGLRHSGCEPRGLRALLVGAGGAGSAIAHALVDAGVASLALHDADAQRRGDLARKLLAYGGIAPTTGSDSPEGYDLVINATPMGMRAGDPLPIRVDILASSTFVGDVVTMPPVPPLIECARAIGCRTMTGAAMFEAVRDRMVDFLLESTARTALANPSGIETPPPPLRARPANRST